MKGIPHQLGCFTSIYESSSDDARVINGKIRLSLYPTKIDPEAQFYLIIFCY